MPTNKEKIKGAKFVNARNGVIVAASAVAAAASAWDRTHRRVTGADLTETQMRVQRLSDLRAEQDLFDDIDSGLCAEWGDFAFLGFGGVEEMAAAAGGSIFVVVDRDEQGLRARGIVQTILTDVHGDAALLEEAYPNFDALTSTESWKSSRTRGGDTAVLLQITTLGPTDLRGGGLGSLLRNTVLNMLPRSVEYALTTTPVDGVKPETIDGEDPSTYTPAMRFHSRGGASPARLLPGYKTPATGATVTDHGRDVIVMRYARDDQGMWPAKRPPMRIRSVGPLQERVLKTGRSLRTRALKAPRPALPSFRAPSIHAPSIHAPSIHAPSIHAPSLHAPKISVPRVSGDTRVVRSIRSGAARLRRRTPDAGDEQPESEEPASSEV